MLSEQLRRRLARLKEEFETGRKALEETDARQASLRSTLLRLSGAIQVLEEELAQAEREAEAPGTPERAGPLRGV